MKNIIFSTILILTTITSIYAQTIEVKQDGTGDFTVIQDAVDASEDGQTVLVWPGTYYENIVLSGKDITLASLVHTTGDSTYKFITIINGNQVGGCIDVRSVNGEKTTVSIIGFTLTNGSGSELDGRRHGGGIFLLYSDAIISHCNITNNSVLRGRGGGIYLYWESSANINKCLISDNYSTEHGGGILCYKYSELNIRGSTICNNHANDIGGGLSIAYFSEVYFDTIDLCNIYENFAERGCDIAKSWTNTSLNIVVDTFTVLTPDTYFISLTDEEGYQVDDVSFEALNSKIIPYDGNLYVNPIVGNNGNSGTSPDEPLESVAYAYSKIAVDSLERNTIHLSNGVYSDSANSEKFPLNIRPYINVVGESMQGTIFDGGNKTRLLKGNNDLSNYSFSNLYFIRGAPIDYEDIYTWDVIYANLYNQLDNISFDSITFDGGICRGGYGALFIKPENNFNITNCTFNDIIGARALRISSTSNSNFGDTVRISNCRFLNNKPDTNNPTSNLSGGGCAILKNRGVVLVSNCLFDNNNTNALLLISTQTWMSNCTFVNNSQIHPTSTLLIMGSDFYMYNCIMYDNGEIPISISYMENNNSELYVYNSLLEDGEESITIYDDAFLYYDDATNIDEDPIFTGIGENPYQIDYGSPCIDAGTLELPSFITIPEFDLAGNPRIVGETIDMGAYEWNPTVGMSEYQPINQQVEKLINVAPNPFTDNTKITVTTPVSGNVRLEVYNNYGQRVKVLLNSTSLSGKSILNWNGKDGQNIMLPPGNYHIVLIVNNKEVDEVTVIKL